MATRAEASVELANDFSETLDDGISTAVNANDSSSIIGASLLPFLGRNNKGDSGETSLLETGDWSPKRNHASLYSDRYREKEDCNPKWASLILHGGNFAAQEGMKRRRIASRKRILLRGPPRSGKTSLAMNLAYAEAAMDRGLECVSAIVYRPAKRRISNDNDDDNNPQSASSGESSDPFPLFCRALPAQIETQVDKARNTQDEEDHWDPDTLSRIRICHVSSLRELLEDMLVLAGKEEDEQPTRAIVVEDLDQIIEGDPNRNHLRGTNGKNNKHNHFIATLLKTVAIAADTALAIENKQNECRSRLACPSRIALLLTLTTPDSRQNQRDDVSVQNLRNKTMDSGDILAVASCIDTIVTLSENNKPRAPKKDGVWKIPKSMTKGNSSRDKDTNTGINNGSKSNLADGTETLVINSIWQAEIQERGCDDYSRNSGDVDMRGVSLIEYAFVESFLPQENSSLGECERSTELRWKD